MRIFRPDGITWMAVHAVVFSIFIAAVLPNCIIDDELSGPNGLRSCN